MAVKKLVFRWIQPVTLGVIVLFWALAPKTWVEGSWTIVIASAVTTAFIQALEFINERHVGWRLNRREFLTDLFYVVLASSVIAKLVTKLADEPLGSAKHALGITTAWAQHSPFIVQVAFTVFLIEFGQYWMHRAMHNSFLWWTHAPHHHITQLNAMKGAVGNPVELFLVSLSVVALFDLDKGAVFCALNVLTAVSSFAHANVRFDPPRWYSFFWTTIEAHSLHHSITYLDTRCNYANSLILCDRLCGTYRAGESQIVGQDERKRLTIKEQLVFPLRPLLAMIKAKAEESASAAR
jgi:sterol desaturase/sphingolipid hydroxylase (fatty acid hydroxylase superfamily)